MRLGKSRGSYLPVLMTLVQKTLGPILELGVGFCSTPYLHWACYPTKRLLVSYENNPEYYAFAESWRDDFHEIHCITDWDSIDIKKRWAIALIDHSPEERRVKEIRSLVRHADFVVAHDSENRSERKYHYSHIFKFFKYRWKYERAYPHTTIFSNKYDITNFSIA